LFVTLPPDNPGYMSRLNGAYPFLETLFRNVFSRPRELRSSSGRFGMLTN